MLDRILLRMLQNAIDEYRKLPGEGQAEVVEHVAARLLMASSATVRYFIVLHCTPEEAEQLRQSLNWDFDEETAPR